MAIRAKKLSYPRQGFRSFAEFYPFYLGEHMLPSTRILHAMATSWLIAMLALSLVTLNPKLLLLTPLSYVFAWVGHFCFEKNKPATFKNPVYSLLGDFVMMYELVTRQRPLDERASSR